MTAEAKVLEITIDGTLKGLVHLIINGNLKIRRLKIDKIKDRLKIKNMLDPETDYIHFGYEQYIQILEKSIQASFPDQTVQVTEKNLGGLERLYKKNALRNEQNHASYSKWENGSGKNIWNQLESNHAQWNKQTEIPLIIRRIEQTTILYC